MARFRPTHTALGVNEEGEVGHMVDRQPGAHSEALELEDEKEQWLEWEAEQELRDGEQEEGQDSVEKEEAEQDGYEGQTVGATPLPPSTPPLQGVAVDPEAASVSGSGGVKGWCSQLRAVAEDPSTGVEGALLQGGFMPPVCPGSLFFRGASHSKEVRKEQARWYLALWLPAWQHKPLLYSCLSAACGPAMQMGKFRYMGFKSCALVGNSGILPLSDYGKAIDAHQVVFRFNHAPAVGSLIVPPE